MKKYNEDADVCVALIKRSVASLMSENVTARSKNAAIHKLMCRFNIKMLFYRSSKNDSQGIPKVMLYSQCVHD